MPNDFSAIVKMLSQMATAKPSSTMVRGIRAYPEIGNVPIDMLMSLNQYGRPNVDTTSLSGNAYFNPLLNTIYAGNRSDPEFQSNIDEELGHAKQLHDNGLLGFLLLAMRDLPTIMRNGYDATYHTPNTLEYNAHTINTPVIIEDSMRRQRIMEAILNRR